MLIKNFILKHKELAVGVMVLNTQINYETLEESFELSPFAGLKRLNKTPIHKRRKDDSSVRYKLYTYNK